MISQWARFQVRVSETSQVSLSGSGIARVRPHELLEVVLERRPPAGVVPGLLLRPVDHADAARVHVHERRLHGVDRIERVLAAVDDEQGLVAQVVQEEVAADRELRAAQDQHVAVERQERRVRRGVAHRDEIGAGAAVGDAGHDHQVLVHVVVALHVFENRAQAGDLLVAPPRRRGPAGRRDVDLFGAGEPDRAVAAQRRVFAHHAAVQLEAHLVFLRRIVGVRDDEPVGEDAVTLLQRPLRHTVRVRAPLLQLGILALE